MIVGGIVGGIAISCLVVFIYSYYKKRRLSARVDNESVFGDFTALIDSDILEEKLPSVIFS